jgi:hypothetical protein
MKRFFLCLFWIVLLPQHFAQGEEAVPNGKISGVVVTATGEPAKNVRLTASFSFPGGHSGDYPHSRTNNAGEYQFQKLPTWGRYVIYADDEAAGYSRISTGPIDGQSSGVEITPEHPASQYDFSLPPRAGLIRVHLRNRRTGVIIPNMTISFLPVDNQGFRFTTTCRSDHPILVPPDQSLLIHVSADGFREWDESSESGRPISVPSGQSVMLDVELDPPD